MKRNISKRIPSVPHFLKFNVKPCQLSFLHRDRMLAVSSGGVLEKAILSRFLVGAPFRRHSLCDAKSTNSSPALTTERNFVLCTPAPYDSSILPAATGCMGYTFISSPAEVCQRLTTTTVTEEHPYHCKTWAAQFHYSHGTFSLVFPFVYIHCQPIALQHHYGKSWIDISIEHFTLQLHNYIEWHNEKRIKISLGRMNPMEYRRSI